MTNTVLFASNIGDTVDPVVESLVVNQDTVLTGDVSGAGFVAAVTTIIGECGYDPAAVAITGGTINGTTVGATTKAAGGFTTLTANGAATLTANTASTTTTTGTLVVTGGVGVSGAINAGGALGVAGVITPSTTLGIVGTTLADSAQAGSVGQVITGTGTGVSVTNATLLNVTSVSLTAGDWDVSGAVTYIPDVTTTPTSVAIGSSIVSATLPAAPLAAGFDTTFATGKTISIVAPTQRVNVSVTTTVYLVGYSEFAISTMTATGTLLARRRR